MKRNQRIALGVGSTLIFVLIGWQLVSRLFNRDEFDLPQPTAQPSIEETLVLATLDAPPIDEVEITLTEGSTPTRSSGTIDLASGRFYPVTRDGSGEVSVIELSDGTRFVRFDPFAVQDGADLRVVLVPVAPVAANALGEIESGYDLGELYTTRGAQNYPVPAEVDLSLYKSVVIWSASIRIVFIAAPLTPSE